ncbi:cyclin-Q-like isoform X2 [Liolophura sinensis]
MRAITLATASVIYHKFFRCNNVKDYDPYLVATTAMYLASKTEENLSKLRDVINVCYRTLHKNRRPLEIGDDYWAIRKSVAQCELFIMRMLNFKVVFSHPHKYMLHYIKSLRDWFEPYQWERLPVARTAWALLRDSYYDSTICLCYKPQHIAIAMIYFALQAHGTEVPFTKEADTKWWKAFDEDVSVETIQDIIVCLMDMYDYENMVR